MGFFQCKMWNFLICDEDVRYNIISFICYQDVRYGINCLLYMVVCIVSSSNILCALKWFLLSIYFSSDVDIGFGIFYGRLF